MNYFLKRIEKQMIEILIILYVLSLSLAYIAVIQDMIRQRNPDIFTWIIALIFPLIPITNTILAIIWVKNNYLKTL